MTEKGYREEGAHRKMLTTKGVHTAARGVPPSLPFLYRVCPLIVLANAPTNENGRAWSWPRTEAMIYIRMSCSCRASAVARHRHSICHLLAPSKNSCCIGSPSRSAMTDHFALGSALPVPSCPPPNFVSSYAIRRAIHQTRSAL